MHVSFGAVCSASSYTWVKAEKEVELQTPAVLPNESVSEMKRRGMA